MSDSEGTLFLEPPSGDAQEAATGPAVLVFIAPPGPLLGRRFELGEGEHVIGRLDENAIPVALDGVSRRHAVLRSLLDGSWLLMDLGSTNGTWVNDDKVVEPRVLKDGDRVRLGAAIAKFLTGANAEAAYHEEIYRMTVVDALTGVHNKRYLLEFLDREVSAAARHGTPLSLVMFDIDHFKKVNDTHGHLAGDAVLREIGERMRPRVRREDLLARYGGEEFGCVLPKTGLADAVAFAEQLRELVAGEPFAWNELRLPITISLGVAELAACAAPTPEDLIRRADEHLYAAKHGGRNRVVGS